MRNVCDPITTPLEDFDFVVEALLKSARLTVETVIERSQKGIKTFQPAPVDLPDPIGNGARGRLLALLGIKDGAQLFAQLVGLAQIRRAFQEQFDRFPLLRIEVRRVAAKRPHRAFEQFVFFFFEPLLQFTQCGFSQFVGALAIRLRHVEAVNHHAGLRNLFFDSVRVAFVHIGADTLDACPQFQRDRAQEGHHRLFLPIGQHAEQRNLFIGDPQGNDHDKIPMAFAQRDLIHTDDLQLAEAAPIDRALHATVDRAQDRVVTHSLLARHITHRTIDQLTQQRLIKGFGVRRARLVPVALLRRCRMIVASRTAETLRAQLDEHSLFQNWQMPQSDRIIVAVKLKSLLPAPRADRIGASTLDRNDDLSLFQFGLQNADFGKVQRKLDHWRHSSILLKKDFVRLQPATTSTTLQDHNIWGHFRQFPESRNYSTLRQALEIWAAGSIDDEIRSNVGEGEESSCWLCAEAN